MLAGAGAAWPLTASAQRAGKVYRVGILFAGFRQPTASPLWLAFEEGLRELGWVDGRNLAFEWRPAEGKLERLPSLAAQLVAMKADVIVVIAPAPMRAAKAATQTIPIVMIAGSADPIGEGLIASYARPGGNITGLTHEASPERFGKQLQLLQESMGRLSRVGILWDLDIDLYRRTYAPALEKAAIQLGFEVKGPFQVLQVDDIERVFAAMKEQGMEATLAFAGSVLFPNRARVAEVAARHRMPLMTAFREFTQAGGLMSYGPNFPAIYRRAAYYVDRILKGANPADLPVEQPTKYDFAVNVRTAKALGITIPMAFLSSANEVIE
jgi:putative ABC transport system substrate-binding protein